MIDLSKKRYRLRIVIPAYPAFNIYSRVAKRTTALGPVCVASSAAELEGWDVEIIDENNISHCGPKNKDGNVDHEFLQKERPADVIGLYGGLTSTIPRLYEIARFYKGKGVITVAGGQHFSGGSISEGLSSGLDYVVKGEGEETIKELLKMIEGNGKKEDIKGIAYTENTKVVCTEERIPIEDFDKLPLPDFSLLRYAKIRLYPVERIRGCGMDCEFCTVKGRPRWASPERSLESIKFLLETKNARHFFIVDDLFGQQRDETIRFCRMLRDYQENVGKRLDLAVQIRLDKAKDPELLKAMREAGISSVAIGFESPIEEELDAMKKHIRSQEMIDLARIYHKFGFLVHGMFIFGYPLKDAKIKMPIKERIKIIRRFIKETKVDTIQMLLPVPLPGTELRHRLAMQNRVYSNTDIGWEYYDGNFPLYKPDEPITPEEMQDAVKKIMGKFYRFKYMFAIGLHIFSFPALFFFILNIKHGWRIWYRSWRNASMRFGGWLVMRGWIQKFKTGDFLKKLNAAKEHLNR